LAESYDVAIIKPDLLVERAIKIAGTAPAVASLDSALLLLGEKAKKELLEKGGVDDSTLVSLVVFRIKQISNQSPTAGWVLVDFPRTRTQVQLLEKELCSYEEQKPVKPGNLKRAPTPAGNVAATAGAAQSSLSPATASKDKNPTKRKSLLTPETSQMDNVSSIATSCFDQVLLLSVDNETAFKRAAGRKINLKSGELCHIEDFTPGLGLVVRKGFQNLM
jgi:hypothetical protein